MKLLLYIMHIEFTGFKFNSIYIFKEVPTYTIFFWDTTTLKKCAGYSIGETLYILYYIVRTCWL